MFGLINSWRLKGKLVVGKNEELRKEFLSHFHNSRVGGHVGIEKGN